jgi:aldehyde:ferredoxin oxidoreductase
VLSSRGWSERGFDGTDDVGIEAARAAAHGRERADEAVAGGFRVETDAGETVPRGATAMTLGAGLVIDDFDAVAELGELCNRLGIDLISAGNAVAWAVRASEEGLVADDYAFGDPAGARALLTDIAARNGTLGDALADGVAEAAEELAGDGLVPTVKGMELPAYDPRGAASMALAYATSDRGGCHRRARPVEREPFDGPFTPAEAATAVIDAQDTRSVRWSLVSDDFAGETLRDDGAEWLEAVGAPHGDLAATGERVWNLVRLFNVREEFTRADDRLPDPIDPASLDASFEALLDAYYDARGWDADGVPTDATLARLDLDHLADDIA